MRRVIGVGGLGCLLTSSFMGCSSTKRVEQQPNQGVTQGTSSGTSAGGNTATGSGTEGGGGTFAGAAGGTSSSECEQDQVRCAGLIPQHCSELGQWVASRAACAVACYEGECVACKPGSRECRDGAVQECLAGAWTTVEACGGACEGELCVSTCTESRYQCNGDRWLQQCTDGKYVDHTECDFLCRNSACTGECVPDSRRCNPDADDESQSCNAQGQWDQNESCQNSGKFCVLGDCKPCSPGTKRCSDSGPQLCSDTGEWVNQGACTSPSATCFEGDCVPCLPGETRCTENAVEQCRLDGSGFDVVETCGAENPACLESTKTCGKCSQGTRQCLNDELQLCNDQGAWQTDQACSGTTPQCVNAECKACDPTANERRCQTPTSAQTCSSDGSWGPAETCSGDTPVCREDLNFTCGCDEGERRCESGTVSELCEGGAWVAQPCSGSTPACSPSSGECVECASGSRACGTCNGGTQTCNAQNQWGSCQNQPDLQTSNQHCGSCNNTCPSGKSCQSGSCQCNSGTHACGASCFSDSDADNCGPSCDDCSDFVGTTDVCSGNQCACETVTLACGASVPTCGSWDFNSNTLEGWEFGTYYTDSSAAVGDLEIATINGTPAMTVEFDNSDTDDSTDRVEFAIDLCPSTALVNLSTYVFSYDIYLKTGGGSGKFTADGSADAWLISDEGVITACTPNNPASDVWTTFSCSFLPGAAEHLVIVVRLSRSWTGDIYIDNARLTPE